MHLTKMTCQHLACQLMQLDDIHLVLELCLLQADVKQLYRASHRFHVHAVQKQKTVRLSLDSIKSEHRTLHVHCQLYLQ